MRRSLIIALVVVMLVTGVPIVMGGMGAACHDCGPAMVSANGCGIAILIMFSLLVVMLVTYLRPRRFICELQLVSAGLDRPPRVI